MEKERIEKVEMYMLWKFKVQIKMFGSADILRTAVNKKVEATNKAAEDAKIAEAVAKARPQGILGLFV